MFGQCAESIDLFLQSAHALKDNACQNCQTCLFTWLHEWWVDILSIIFCFSDQSAWEGQWQCAAAAMMSSNSPFPPASTSRPTSPAQLQLASHPYYLSWQYNQCFLPMLLNVFLLALIASFSLHCTSKWVWQITTIYLPRYTGFLCRAILKVGESNLTKTWASKTKILGGESGDGYSVLSNM